MRSILALLTLAGATAAGAQPAAATIDPGMTREQVVERLGQPAAERSAGSFKYLFYQNGCERECGMSDLVTLENDAVVDAIFRSTGRRYSGASSSPTGIQPEATSVPRAGALSIGGTQPPPRGGAAQVGGVRVESIGPAVPALPERPDTTGATGPPGGAPLEPQPARAPADSARWPAVRPPGDTSKGPPPEE